MSYKNHKKYYTKNHSLLWLILLGLEIISSRIMALFLALGLTLSLCGCGQLGPLYLKDTKESQETNELSDELSDELSCNQ